MSEFCRLLVQPRICREMDSQIDLKFEISDFKRAKPDILSITHSMLRTSPAEPRAIYKKQRSSLVDPRSNPSDILLDRSCSPNSQILYPELHKLAPSERLVTCKLSPEHLMPFWRQPCAQSDFARYFGKPAALFSF